MEIHLISEGTMSETLGFTLILLTGIYLAVLFYLARGLKRLPLQKRTSLRPAISVVVCAHNEERNLPDCISRLQAQTYPADKVEFILVNDRSSDATEALMREAAQNDPRFSTFSITDRDPAFGPKKRAIDLAIRRAKGELILLTDADGRTGPKWAETMVSYFTEDVHMVLGYAPYAIKPANHFTKKVLALEYLSHAAIAASTCGLGYPITCVGTNMAYRKSMYLEIDGFGEYKAHISGDDDLFLTRVREAKRYGIAYATDKESHVFNNPPQLWSKFIHQRMRYASKGFEYPAKVTAGLIAYFSFNLLFLIMFVMLFWDSSLAPYFGGALTAKWIGEFWFMRKAGQTLNDLRHLKTFIYAALMHIPYVVIFALLGQLNYYQWADTNPAHHPEA